MTLKDFLPPSEKLSSLEAEEIGSLLLEYMCQLEETRQSGLLHRGNFTLTSHIAKYTNDNKEGVAKLVMEGWDWLKNEGLIAYRPGDKDGWIFVTRKGYRLRDRKNLDAYKKGNLLPKHDLDKNLIENVYPLFLRGDYDTAVFRAFKEVEVRIRKKAGLDDGYYGVKLIKAAFHPNDGLLIEKTIIEAERVAMFNLFNGSIGLFKNPLSHRDVDFSNPGEVAEIILFANYLLRLVERQKFIDVG